MEEKLIIAVANHPVLYDQTLFTYRGTNQRSQSWREGAETVGENRRFSPVWGVYIRGLLRCCMNTFPDIYNTTFPTLFPDIYNTFPRLSNTFPGLKSQVLNSLLSGHSMVHSARCSHKLPKLQTRPPPPRGNARRRV